jgi:hypothetical protein
MARQYLAEGLKGSFPFIADPTKIVTESLPSGGSRTRIPGRFSVCDCINGNGRRYSKRVWEKNLQPGSPLTRSIQENAAWGLLEHPKDGQVTLQSPICIRTTDAKLQEGRDENGNTVWEVVGEISILNPKLVPEAARLVAMIEEGYCPRVSSRGFGSLVRATDGVDEVQEDYVCEGWDVVMKPSFESAILRPQPESTSATTSESSKSEPNKISENVNPAPTNQAPPTPETKTNLEAERGSQAPTAGVSAPVKPTIESSQTKTMNLSEIKSQIATYRGMDPSKLSPQRFAEGMSQLGMLHQEVANYVAEDAKRSWQGQQLHEEIKAIENSWEQRQLAPVRQAAKMQESNTKLMQVLKATAQTALTFKKKLGEGAKAQARQTALLHEVTERGQAWRQQAKANEAKAAAYQRRFMMASEALHQFANKYKTDITEMGRALLKSEFHDKVNDPAIQEMLNSASKPKHLVPIRLALEGKIETTAAKGILEGKISLDETLKGLKGASSAAQVNKSKKTAAPPVAEGKKPAASAKGSPTAPVSEGVVIVSSKPGDPRELNEAVSMVARLSEASANR